MFMSEYLGPEYSSQLVDYGFDSEHVEILNNVRRQTVLPHYGPEIYQQYVRLGEQLPTEKPVIAVLPFTGDTVNNAPFIAALAEQQLNVIALDQNVRKNAVRDWDGRLNATFTQALGNLEVISAEGLTRTPLNVVTESWGSLVFQEMVEEAQSRGWTCFDEAAVVLVAPAGSNENEKWSDFAKRLNAKNASEGKSLQKIADIPDSHGRMLKAGLKIMSKNPIRTVQEVFELRYEKVDYESLVKKVGSLLVAANAQDELFTYNTLDSTLERAVNAGVGYVTPFDSVNPMRATGERLGAQYAVHDDGQFFPRRTAQLVANSFRAAISAQSSNL